MRVHTFTQMSRLVDTHLTGFVNARHLHWWTDDASTSNKWQHHQHKLSADTSTAVQLIMIKSF